PTVTTRTSITTITAAAFTARAAITSVLALGHAAFRLGQERLAAETGLAVTLHTEALDLDDIPLGQHIARVLHPDVVDLRDVEQRLVVRQNFHERAEVDDTLDRALVDLARLRLRREPFDDLDGASHRFRIRTGDVDRAVVLDIDCASGLLGN